MPDVTVFDHPLIQHKLTWMRDRSLSDRPFRALMAQIAGLMVFEATRTFPTIDVDVDTPLQRALGKRIVARITVVPVLRAGLAMAEGILDIMPEARVGHLGMVRDEATLKPRPYLQRLPRDLAAGPVLLVDPMLATGGSACESIGVLRRAGARDLRFICLVAAPEGVARLQKEHPDVPIYAAAVDQRLNERGYILPGLGDAG
ncbi:MAG: uracil phosphoribosyltransferase, partial [Phycisphaerales bacterium]|nr:uracil phosphoribosyltransferase [Phycisphaerales bacterium]